MSETVLSETGDKLRGVPVAEIPGWGGKALVLSPMFGRSDQPQLARRSRGRSRRRTS